MPLSMSRKIYRILSRKDRNTGELAGAANTEHLPE